MSLNWTLRPIEEVEISRIVELLKLVLKTPNVPRTVEFWRWKHIDNPFGRSLGVVAEVDDKIAGIRVFMRWTWKSQKCEVPAVRAVDTVTHPEWQRKGIFSQLTGAAIQQLQKENISLIFNTPNRYSLPGYLKMGWKSVGRTSLYVKPLRIFPWPFRKNGTNFRTSVEGRNRIQAISETYSAKGDFEAESRLHTARTNKFLEWRYRDVPGIQYDASWNSESSDFAGLIFRLRFRKQMREITINELFVSPGTEGKAADLLRNVGKENNGDYMLAMAAENTPEQSALKRAGFFKLPHTGPLFVVNLLSGNCSQVDPLRWSNWRCSIGDLELF